MSVSALEKKAIGDAVSNYVCDDLADHDGIESDLSPISVPLQE